MELEFQSEEELFKRLCPAIHAKQGELRRLGYSNVTEDEIWSYLKINKWARANNLMLADMVNDILHLDNKTIMEYVDKNKNQEETEII